MRLQDKVVLITAATRGIGLACVNACAAEGARVYMAARNLPAARETAANLCAQGLRVTAIYQDAAHPETFRTMAETVARETGHIDVLVNNFGTSDPKQDLDLRNTPSEEFLRILTINTRSVFLGAQAVLPYMTAKTGGSIINISSVGGAVPDISQISYGTSKAAINYLTKLIAVQEAKHNIRCNAVLPGMTATDAVSQKLSPAFRDLFLRHIPLGRMGLPEEIAAAVVYLASDDAAYATGQILTLSGGFGLATPIYGDLLNQSRHND